MCVCSVQATRTRTKKTFLDAAMGLAACFLVRAHLLTDSSPGRFVYLVVLLPRVLSLLLASCGAALTNIPLPQGTPFLLELHVCSRGRVFGPHTRPRGVAPFREVFPASQSLQQLGSRRLCGRNSRWGPGRSPGPGGAVRQNEDRCALRWFDLLPWHPSPLLPDHVAIQYQWRNAGKQLTGTTRSSSAAQPTFSVRIWDSSLPRTKLIFVLAW